MLNVGIAGGFVSREELRVVETLGLGRCRGMGIITAASFAVGVGIGIVLLVKITVTVAVAIIGWQVERLKFGEGATKGRKFWLRRHDDDCLLQYGSMTLFV